MSSYQPGKQQYVRCIMSGNTAFCFSSAKAVFVDPKIIVVVVAVVIIIVVHLVVLNLDNWVIAVF